MSNNPDFTQDDEAAVQSMLEHVEGITVGDLIAGKKIPPSVSGFMLVIWDKHQRLCVRRGTDVGDKARAEAEFQDVLEALKTDAY